MKKLLLILLLITALTEINSSFSSYSEEYNNTRKEILIVMPEKLIIASDNIWTPTSIIPDSIFNHQLYLESGGKHLVKDKDNNLTPIMNTISGALGIAQFLPSTWNWLKANGILPAHFSINIEEHQIIAQRLFMNYLIRQDYGIEYDKVRLALASYNAGSGRVLNLIKKYGNDWEAHLPKETKKYLKIISG